MDKHKSTAIGHRIIAVFLMAIMIGCIAPISYYAYAEEPVVTEENAPADTTAETPSEDAAATDTTATDPAAETGTAAEEGTPSVGTTTGEGTTGDGTTEEPAEEEPVPEAIQPPAAPAKISALGLYEKIKLSWTAVKNTDGKDGKVYYEIRDAKGNVVKTKLTNRTTNIKFDPYPGDKKGMGRSGVAKKATFRVYTYIIDPVSGEKIYSTKGIVKKNIEVIHPMYVRIKVKNTAKIYPSSSSYSSVGTAKKGTYYIGIGGSRINGENKRIVIKVKGKLRYIKSGDVTIEKMWYNAKAGSNPYKKAGFSKKAIEAFINDRNLKSTPKTGPKRLIWINTYNQRLYLFAMKKNKWVIDSQYPNGILCNTGKELTPYGVFKITSKWEVKEATGTRWWCIFNAVGIHQKLGDKLGKPASGGCVRIPTDDAKKFYTTLIKKRTTVFVY